VLAQRLIAVIAPTVQQIAQRSRSPGELVLRRPLGDNRREEIFISTADLLKRLDGLPLHAREVFAPLRLGGEPGVAPVDEPRRPARPAVEIKPAPAPPPAAVERTVSTIDRKFDTEPEIRAEARPPRTMPPPAPLPEGRSRPDRLPSLTGAAETRRTRTPPPREQPPSADLPIFDDQTPPFSRHDTGRTLAKPHAAVDAVAAPAPHEVDKQPEMADGNRRRDDSLSDAIDRALADDDTLPR
jgi:hypothetical protein